MKRKPQLEEAGCPPQPAQSSEYAFRSPAEALLEATQRFEEAANRCLQAGLLVEVGLALRENKRTERAVYEFSANIVRDYARLRQIIGRRSETVDDY